jgi:lipid-A-disaccharide synthase-like uncharacterized protein
MLAIVESDILRDTPWYWWVIGFGGQAMFASRFVVQWIASERQQRSVIPVAFWYLSLVGGLLALSYAIFRTDPVFILAQATGSFVYLRNLQLIRRQKRSET